MASEPVRTYPSDLPVVPLRQTLVFPLTLQPLAVNRPLSIESVNRALAGDRLLFFALQNDPQEEPNAAGCAQRCLTPACRQMTRRPNDQITK